MWYVIIKWVTIEKKVYYTLYKHDVQAIWIDEITG